MNSPTSPYEMFQTKPTIAVQRPNPTREPTNKPQKRRTPIPTRTNSAASPVAASFLGGTTSSFTIIPPLESLVVEHHSSPSKGQEQQLGLGEKISNQIQQQMATKKTEKGNKKGKRGQKKGAKKKNQKRQKKIKKRQKNPTEAKKLQ
eukprot:CAMPEP_0201921260 /NCGR_PEP_ID=MMETSP0903-20130614/9641_1 /ASSEMBLY_ACC=CAM_ASM_000552 /TAXON_ID=420261 /ORGANISM="Thalassiosira antarctica, Strain CCMP982" /LENGTH=146 /DNA_ID=CAMNT_0048458185 /DNA_START=223 /DNA_END=663 /DNA_ORIENTATION=+